MTNHTTELFESTTAPAPERPPCWMTVVARRKLGQGDNWHWCQAERIGADDLLVAGGIPGVYVKGKRKGRQKWEGVSLTKCVITRAETDQAQADYESTTGKCRDCGGSGQDWERWNHQTGHHYRPCKRCSATGKASEVPA